MTNSEQEWAKAIKDCNAKVYNFDSLNKIIEPNQPKPMELDYKKLQIYFATKTKRGIEHFTSFITTIRGEKYKVYKFYSRTRINRIITRPKLRIKL